MEIYETELQRVTMLEVSQYLENYLWPNFDHVMSMMRMINEKVCFTNSGGAENLDPRPPFRIRLPKMLKNNTNFTPWKTKSTTDSMNDAAMKMLMIEAITSGIQPGLTMVVGPPGMAKTDTAVQILNILYHNCPTQRTLTIPHSNEALNDLFKKIMQRDVPAHYLL